MTHRISAALVLATLATTACAPHALFGKRSPQSVAVNPDLPGDAYEFKGDDGGVTESNLFVAEAPGAVPLSCAVTGTGRVANILVNMPGTAPDASLTPDEMHRLTFGTEGTTVKRFFEEVSYGKYTITGDTYGWYTLDINPPCGSSTQMFNVLMASVLRAMNGKVDLSRYDRIAIYGWGKPECPYSGISSLGCQAFSREIGGPTVFRGSMSWANAENSLPRTHQGSRIHIMAHELGHALGLHHANYRSFATGAYGAATGFVKDAIGPVSSPDVESEYGDYTSSMGRGPGVHFNAPHKAQLGWLANYDQRAIQPGPYYLDALQDGSYLVDPMDAQSNGDIKALRFARGGSSYDKYWVEYRRKAGMDASLLDTADGIDGAILHFEGSGVKAAYTHVLDLQGGDYDVVNNALRVGRWFSDPYVDNFAIGAESLDGGRLRVGLRRGSRTCESQPSVALAVANGRGIFNAGEAVELYFTMKNNDSTACTPSVPMLRGLLPGGWSLSEASPLPATIGPRQSATARLLVNIPDKKVDFIGYNIAVEGQLGGGPAAPSMRSVTVSAFGATLSANPAGPTYSRGQQVTFDVKVYKAKNPSVPAPKVFVGFVLRDDAGQSLGGVNVPGDANGRARWTRSLPTTPGTYRLEVFATAKSLAARDIEPLTIIVR